MRLRKVLAALAALALAACGSDSKPLIPSGWMSVPGMICGDGSQTGIGISRGRSDSVLVYLAGGGACWSASACNNAFRSFGKQEFDVLQLLASGTIFDRTLAGNPFASWTIVFVPYCTGDVHAGDSHQSYGGTAWNHHGYRNLQAAVAAITSALPRPAEVVVAGSSAGGFGSLAAYGMVRAEWDAAGATSASLVDDSGPTFVTTAIPGQLLADWWEMWGLSSTIGQDCSDCQTDLSAMWRTLRAKFPDDRHALISTTQDLTMRGFFADPVLGDMSAQDFEAALAALALKLDGLGPLTATYRIGDASATRHALLADAPFLGSPQGPAMLQWLSDDVSARPWSSVP